MANRPHLSAHEVEGFVTRFMLADYAHPVPIAHFHREWWEMCCDPHPYVAIAAPRSHSKTTTINIGYSLATAIAGEHPFQIKVSRSRPIAIEFLRTVKNIIANNAQIAKTFRFQGFERDTEDDFIANFGKDYQIRMIALGTEQTMRGFNWGTMRASLIVCDDLEDDEEVLNADRRNKTMDWFLNTLMPMGDVDMKMRVAGTFLHHQSLLKRLCDSEEWFSRIYEAHNDDFSQILWPEMFTREILERIRRNYIKLGKLIGYNMEYRNQTSDRTTGYFVPEDFKKLNEDDRKKPHIFYCGVDPSISTESGADRTSMVVAGTDPDGYLDFYEERGGRWDGYQIIDELFLINETYKIADFFVESGSILKALMPGLEMEQRRRGTYLSIRPMTPIKNKLERARSLQSRMRAKAVRWEKDGDWYPLMETEMLNFRGEDEQNDRVDAAAWIGMGLGSMVSPLSVEEQDEEDARAEENSEFSMMGRNETVGY